MNDGDMVALVRAKSPSKGSGTLSSALTVTPVVASWDVHSCPPTTGGGFSQTTSLLLSNGLRQQVFPQTFNIRPTGGPNPQLWYHLERPTSTDPQ
ncbi:hypothetical protein ACTXT7_013545, partial [Hymenolepis weldensis]